MALIYIVEDDKMIRETESFALRGVGYRTVECSCAAEFYSRMEEQLPDLILLDIILPDEDGLSILSKIRLEQDTCRVPVIFVTGRVTELDVVKGLDMGADDYITKPFGVMELISRVKALIRRIGVIDQNRYLISGQIYLDDERHTAYVNKKHVELTYKEYELLRYLMVNKGIVLSRDSIMEKIWSCNYDASSRTLDAHIKSLRKKLGAEGSCIKTVRNVGYFLDGE